MTARSPAMASPAPPPIAAPLIAVTTGVSIFENTRWSCMVSSARAFATLGSFSPLNSARSAPAQNPGPAPVSTTQCIPSSASAVRSAARRSRVSAVSRALRFSGRLSVRMRTLPLSSMRRFIAVPRKKRGARSALGNVGVSSYGFQPGLVVHQANKKIEIDLHADEHEQHHHRCMQEVGNDERDQSDAQNEPYAQYRRSDKLENIG